MEEEKIYKELTKLHALLRERVPHEAFNMKYMYSRNGELCGSEAQKRLAENHECDTAACVWGWSLVFIKTGLLDFDPLRALNSNALLFITCSDWSDHPTEYTLEAACARIEYVLEHVEEPLWWKEQMYGHSPVTYREIN